MKKYIVATIRIPIEISNSGGHQVMNSRYDIDFQLCDETEIPPINENVCSFSEKLNEMVCHLLTPSTPPPAPTLPSSESEFESDSNTTVPNQNATTISPNPALQSHLHSPSPSFSTILSQKAHTSSSSSKTVKNISFKNKKKSSVHCFTMKKHND